MNLFLCSSCRADMCRHNTAPESPSLHRLSAKDTTGGKLRGMERPICPYRHASRMTKVLQVSPGIHSCDGHGKTSRDGYSSTHFQSLATPGGLLCFVGNVPPSWIRSWWPHTKTALVCCLFCFRVWVINFLRALALEAVPPIRPVSIHELQSTRQYNPNPNNTKYNKTTNPQLTIVHQRDAPSQVTDY